MYLVLKHLHMTAAVISISLFLIRFYWHISSSKMLSKRWVKIVPHVVDTILLLCAIGLCFVLSQYPLLNHWLSEKVILLFAYIFFGYLALKPNQGRKLRWSAFALALICILLIVKLALSKSTYLLG